MRVAHLASTFLPVIGGAEVAAHTLARMQVARGVQVTVVTTWSSRQAIRGAVPYDVLPLPPGLMPLVASRRWGSRPPSGLVGAWLAGIDRCVRPDVWHVHMAFPDAVAAAPWLHARRRPWVFTAQGIDIQTVPDIGYGYRLSAPKDARLHRWLPTADGAIAISASMRLELEGLGVPAARIHDIPNGAAVGRIADQPVDRRAVRHRFGLGDDDVVALTVGRDHPKKAFDLLVAAAPHTDPAVCFLVVGRGASRLRHDGPGARVRGIEQIGGAPAEGEGPLWDRLPTPELVDVYRSADLFVLPSLVEGFPLVGVEAMAAALPVVTTDAPGCRDLVDDGDVGRLVPTGDAWALAAAVSDLAGDPAARERLGGSAQRKAQAYAWDRVVAVTDAVYRGVVDA